jgi:nucleotidyltransferase/DNA polymerase involved in DNA repair
MVDVETSVMPPRIAAVHLHQLPLEAAFDPHASASSLCAVEADIRGRSVLIDLSDDGRRRGLLPGMTVTEARARVPELTLKPRDLNAEKRELEIAAEILLAFGSLVEVSPPSFLFVEIGRSSRVLEKMLAHSSSSDPYGAPPSVANGCGSCPDPRSLRSLPAPQPHLEPKLASAIIERMSGAGHRVSVAIAKDPDTARTLAGQISWEQKRKLVPAPPERRASRRRTKAAMRIRDRSAPLIAKSKTSPARSSTKDVVIAQSGRELELLEKLPIEALLWTDARDDPEGIKKERMHAIHSSLRVLGIHDVARLKKLSSAQVATRFGEEGALIMQRALGSRERPLRPFAPPEQIVEGHELDAPVEDLEPLLFVLKRIYSRIEARLEARRLSAGAIELVFDVEPGLDAEVIDEHARAKSSLTIEEVRIAFARPTRRSQTMLALTREKLQGALPGSVRALVVKVLSPSDDRGAQLDLFTSYHKKVEEVSELVGRLVASLGDKAVFSPSVSDTHRPEAAWEMKPFEIERALEGWAQDGSRSKKSVLAVTEHALGSRVGESSYRLPEVSEQLCVAEMPKEAMKSVGSVEAVIEDLERKKKSWPKAIQRKIEDEPLPPLPPRPLELFPKPERAHFHASRAKGRASGEEACVGTLIWRKERMRIVSLSGCERLETEWWTSTPLTREYIIAEVSDGRMLWLFFEPSGEVFVHGAFD